MPEQQPTILCVDDEPMNLHLLETILAPQGYAVAVASSGAEALRQLESRKADVVLLDVMMPEMDGFEVCRNIKDSGKHKNIPVIMITALASKQDRIKGIEAGAEEFLSKPFDQAEVLARIRMLLKVKEMNDNLVEAYSNIARMTDTGEKIIKNFNPHDFDFKAKVDDVISQIIRSKGDSARQPEIVLVRMRSEPDRHEWRRYEHVAGRVKMTEFSLNMQLSLPPSEDSRLLFYNEESLRAPSFAPLRNTLANFAIEPRNLVVYVSDILSIFAMNYGKSVSACDAGVLNAVVMQTLFLRSFADQIRETEDAFEYNVLTLARASEVNDEDTGRHIVRVGLYCALIAQRLNMPSGFVRDIRIQAMLHDVGKIHIPSVILKKPDDLSAGEWDVMKRHTHFGAKIIGDHPRFRMAKEIALTHHERWDGTGYPKGLYRDRIPVEGRITTIADQYDALRNARAYKEAFDHKTACAILTTGNGRTMPKHFDPAVLKAFVGLSSKFEEVYEKNQG